MRCRTSLLFTVSAADWFTFRRMIRIYAQFTSLESVLRLSLQNSACPHKAWQYFSSISLFHLIPFAWMRIAVSLSRMIQISFLFTAVGSDAESGSSSAKDVGWCSGSTDGSSFLAVIRCASFSVRLCFLAFSLLFFSKEYFDLAIAAPPIHFSLLFYAQQ